MGTKEIYQSPACIYSWLISARVRLRIRSDRQVEYGQERPVIVVASGGAEGPPAGGVHTVQYRVDLKKGLQTNVSTGNTRPVRERPLTEVRV